MKKEEFDALVENLDGLGLGTSNEDVAHRLQPARIGALLTSVSSTSPVEFNTKLPLAPWNDSKRSYERREATRMARSCLNSWMRFKPLSSVARWVARFELGQGSELLMNSLLHFHPT